MISDRSMFSHYNNYLKPNMVLQVHHDRYGHMYYTYPEHSKMYYDYGIQGPHLFYEPNRTRFQYHCYWPEEALKFQTAEAKRRRAILRSRLSNAIYIHTKLY